MNKCIGCQRHEIHKYCLAYGTAFYMSGVEYSAEIHSYLLRQVFKMGYEDAKCGNPPRHFESNPMYISYIAGFCSQNSPHLVDDLLMPD